MTLNELLYAASGCKLLVSVNGDRFSVNGKDVTEFAQQAIDAGLITRPAGYRLLVPTDKGSAAYTGDDRCPDCGKWPAEWLGERGTTHLWQCTCGCWQTPLGGTR